MRILKPVLSLLTAVIVSGASGSFVLAGGTAAPDPAGLYEKKCSICHSIKRSRAKKKSMKGWRKTVLRMKSNGAPLTDKEAEIIIRHLTDNYVK